MLHLHAVESDTLELLKSLTKEPILSNNFLVGGTSLALQLGHRISIDLDLFTHQPFDSSLLLEKLKENYDSVQPLTVSDTIFISVINQVKIDCVHFKYPFSFPLIEESNLRLADMRDIAPMKLDAVTKRGSKKDFFDMYFLFEQFEPPQILTWYEQMFKHSTSFHVIRSLVYFEDAETTENPIVFDKKITWTKVKQRMKDVVKKYF